MSLDIFVLTFQCSFSWVCVFCLFGFFFAFVLFVCLKVGLVCIRKADFSSLKGCLY